MIPLKRQIRFNNQPSTDNVDMVNWTILLINDPREIKVYSQRIFKQLKPILEKRQYDGKITNSELAYRLLLFDSEKGKVNWQEIYRGEVRKDERLYERWKRDGLADYVENELG